MGASRMKAAGLWVPAFVSLGLLIGWSVAEIAQIPDGRAEQAFAILVALGILNLVLGWRFRVNLMRRSGLLLVALPYFAAHAHWLPLDAAAAVGFLVVALAHVELRILAERFAPLYLRDLGPEDLARIRASLMRASLRVGAATAMAFLLPIFAGDLALAGTVPVTTIPTALLLAAGLVAVIVLLALLPVWQRRRQLVGSSWAEDPRGKL